MATRPFETLRKLVVFEGLDDSGKTTILSRCQLLEWVNPAPIIVHLPSGNQPWTQNLYRLLEDTVDIDPYARQLLHLACHAETLANLRLTLANETIFLDRWWWSTLAYGAASGLHPESMDSLREICKTIWNTSTPDLILLLDEPHRPVTERDKTLMDTYAALSGSSGFPVVKVPRFSEEETFQFILKELMAREIISRADTGT